MSTITASQPEYTGLLGNVSRAGVYHLPYALHDNYAKLMAAAEELGFAVFRVDLGQATNKEELLAAIGQAMGFPDWFGNNLDALADCLGDLEWAPAEGYLVLLEHCDQLHANAGEDLVATLRIFEAATNEWRERDIALWCLVDMQADGIAWLPGL
jgi:RNAse (barnase) inhibitor barstar